jgi:fructose-specific phosphotransferase system IIC component
MVGSLSRARHDLLAGVSYAIPFVAAGGILIAVSTAFVPMMATGPDFSNAPLLKTLLDIGTAVFGLLVPVLAGYTVLVLGAMIKEGIFGAMGAFAAAIRVPPLGLRRATLGGVDGQAPHGEPIEALVPEAIRNPEGIFPALGS